MTYIMYEIGSSIPLDTILINVKKGAYSNGEKSFNILFDQTDNERIHLSSKECKSENETFVSDNLCNGYSITKLKAEQLFLDASQADFRTISLRPPLIWGKGDYILYQKL